jgi:hypothetical protein
MEYNYGRIENVFAKYSLKNVTELKIYDLFLNEFGVSYFVLK